MINTDQNPRYPNLRVASLVIAVLAVITALTGIVESGSLLAWAVATLALSIFTASFILKP